ncbi:acyl-CoA dehydrogenase family protein [Aquabacterium sp. OR-4]|uniref:acyl-CoA dehydrogenase family protein n=1 Tax=Aquabacterium sp. OR-4 TaxID=2978127 RepID=UPI0021B4173F|nr:acyl-CoA dehydrogenase [Aquabacterium sp. OR-4]MDT7838145.1 acyl-CoA dehydrogenase [Aquabacterium sp. OR-4]
MDFNYSDEQQQLAESLRKFLGAHYGFDQRKAIVHSATGLSEPVWATLAEMGLTAIALPEEDGGFGGGAVDLMAAMEACGEALVVEPLLDNVGLAGRLVARTGTPAQRAALLPGLADGTRRLALAYLEPGRRYDAAPRNTRAERRAEGWVLSGAKSVVIGAPQAHTLIVSAATAEGTRLFIVDPATPGVALSPCRTVDGQRAADIGFSDVALGADALLGGSAGQAQPALDEALDFATALLCAEAVGAMRYAVDATLEYTKTRKQFGVALASFQVLQHRMVEMHIHTETARSMAILAASRVDGTDTSPAAVRERQRAVSAAKLKIADAARLVSQEAVQLHGGMGMTEEMKVSHTFRRLTMLAQRFGDADHHLARFARVS